MSNFITRNPRCLLHFSGTRVRCVFILGRTKHSRPAMICRRFVRRKSSSTSRSVGLSWVSKPGLIPYLCVLSQKVKPTDHLIVSISAEPLWFMYLHMCTSIDGSRTPNRVCHSTALLTIRLPNSAIWPLFEKKIIVGAACTLVILRNVSFCRHFWERHRLDSTVGAAWFGFWRLYRHLSANVWRGDRPWNVHCCWMGSSE